MDYEIIDGIKNEPEILEKEDKDEFFLALVKGKDVTKKVMTSRGEFVIKYPKQKDLLSIGRLMSYNRRGMSAETFDSATEKRNLLCSSLSVVVVSGPAWYENVKKEQGGFSWEEVPDYSFCEELYISACEFRTELQSRFTKNKEPEVVGISTSESDITSVDDGAFSNMSYKS